VYVLRAHARTFLKTHQAAAQALLRDCYMDDVATGAATHEEALQRALDIAMITQGAGFPLRKFVSNSPQLIAGLPEDHRGEQGKKVLLAAAAKADRDLEQPDAPLAAALGCEWEPLADRLSFSAFAVLGNELNRVTKRVMLSITARIFDPLRYLAPIIATPKILIQETWADKTITWDTPLAERLPKITQQFVAWTHTLADLKHIAFAR